jgi:transposase InsO family protein
LAAVLDLATRKIVGWSMRDLRRSELTIAALMMAKQRQRPTAGLICHSDRGSQYAAEAYRKQLAGMKANTVHEPDGLLHRQGPNGELLPHAEGRTRTPATMGNPGRSAT